MVHSSTVLLPAWKKCVAALQLKGRIMPRDVTTRWNSTYDMLSFAVTYRKAIEEFTSDRKNDLREYELTVSEWDIVIELCDLLKVCIAIIKSPPTMLMSISMLYSSLRILHQSFHVPHLIYQL